MTQKRRVARDNMKCDMRKYLMDMSENQDADIVKMSENQDAQSMSENQDTQKMSENPDLIGNENNLK